MSKQKATKRELFARLPAARTREDRTEAERERWMDRLGRSGLPPVAWACYPVLRHTVGSEPLGELYRDGVGVPRNLVSAYRWMHISNQGEGWSTETPEGMVPYQREIDRLADRMTDEELAEARRAKNPHPDEPCRRSGRSATARRSRGSWTPATEGALA